MPGADVLTGGMFMAGVRTGGLAAGLLTSRPGTHILRPQPGQKATLSGISAWHCGHEMGMVFSGQAARRVFLAAILADSVNLKGVAGGRVMVFVSDLLLQAVNLGRKE